MIDTRVLVFIDLYLLIILYMLDLYCMKKVEKMSKYEPLWKYLKENDRESYELTYNEISEILGFKIDHSFLTYKKELAEYGYEVSKISMKKEIIIFNKI